MADFRRSLGLPALTVNWGAIADVGVVARSGNIQDHFARLGIEPLRADTALSILGGLMQNGGGQTAVFPPSDWGKLSRVFPAVTSPRFSRLLQASSQARDGETAGVDVNLRNRILNAPSEERMGIVAGHLRHALAAVLGASPDRLDAEQPLHEMGIDSLMSAEVVVRIQSDVGVDVPPMRFMEGISLSGLAAFIVNEVTRGLMPEAQPA
jgi:acyl carrier protein